MDEFHIDINLEDSYIDNGFSCSCNLNQSDWCRTYKFDDGFYGGVTTISNSFPFKRVIYFTSNSYICKKCFIASCKKN